MTGIGMARIRDPLHECTRYQTSLREKFQFLRRGWRPVALSSHRAPLELGKSAAPRGAGSAPRTAREPSAPTALIKCCTLHTYPSTNRPLYHLAYLPTYNTPRPSQPILEASSTNHTRDIHTHFENNARIALMNLHEIGCKTWKLMRG